jgi:hypothetical protein
MKRSLIYENTNEEYQNLKKMGSKQKDSRMIILIKYKKEV